VAGVPDTVPPAVAPVLEKALATEAGFDAKRRLAGATPRATMTSL
jgi:hypothetical protein